MSLFLGPFFGDILWDLGIWFGGTFVGEGLEALVRWDLFRGALFGRTLSGTFLGGYCWRRALVGGTLSGGPCLEGPCSAGFLRGLGLLFGETLVGGTLVGVTLFGGTLVWVVAGTLDAN